MKQVLIFCAVFAVLLSGLHFLNEDAVQVPQADSLRYIDYAVSLDKFGVFGLNGGDLSEAPAPGNANAPLYPVFIAALMKLDSGLKETLVCINADEPECPLNLGSFLIAQNALTLLSLLLVFLLTIKLTGSRTAGWIAAALALGSGVFTEFQAQFMTEIMVLPVFFGLMLVIAQREKKMRDVVIMGALLAVLTLVRPSYLYLFYGFVLFSAGAFLMQRSKPALLAFMVLVLGFVVIAAPWAVRNKIQFGEYSLTSGGYAEAILMQRLAYNQMSWPEVGMAFVYWLPDFGDSLAEDLFGEEETKMLGWSKESYYGIGNRDATLEAEIEKAGGENQLMPYWIKNEFISNAPKHIAVSAALSWRGAFIAKYWGLIGLIAFIALLIGSVRRQDYRLLLVSLPVWYMVAFHGALSVSISRYNLPLIALYAPAMAFYATLLGQNIVAKIRTQ